MHKSFYKFLQSFLSKVHYKMLQKDIVHWKDIWIFLLYVRSCREKVGHLGKNLFLKIYLNLKKVFAIGNSEMKREKKWYRCYKFQCSSCLSTDYSKTKCYFKVQVFQRKEVAAATRDNIRQTKSCAENYYVKVCESIAFLRTSTHRLKFAANLDLICTKIY